MPRFAANLAWLFADRPLLARCEAAMAAGFAAVEHPRPYGVDLAELRAELDRLGLVQALINTPSDWAAGAIGEAAAPGREAAFRADFEQALAAAETLRAERLHVMAGRASGGEAAAVYVRNLRYAAARAAERAPALILTIEPLNSRDAPGYHLATTEQALGVLDQVGADNLKLQLDLYHCQIMEGDLSRKIEALAPLLGHVQVASVPDRAEPDHGEVHYPHLFELLDQVGYGGWVGCEYRPRSGGGLGWFEPYRAVGFEDDLGEV